MAQQTINIGTTANDHTGDPLRTAFTKINANFTELYTAKAADLQIPSITSHGGSYLTTDGTNLIWVSVPATNTLTNGSYNVSLNSSGQLVFPDSSIQNSAYTSVKSGYNAANATATMGTVTASWIISGNAYHVVYSTLSSSNVTYAYSGMNIIAGVTTSFNSGGTYVMNAANNPNPPWFVGILNTIGDVQIVYIQDITNSKVYRVTAIATTTYAGYSPVPGSILIEQII
jgi:hypothetical protein